MDGHERHTIIDGCIISENTTEHVIVGIYYQEQLFTDLWLSVKKNSAFVSCPLKDNICVK